MIALQKSFIPPLNNWAPDKTRNVPLVSSVKILRSATFF